MHKFARLLIACLPFFLSTAYGMSTGKPRLNPSVVTQVDLQKYAGLWYEIARTPMYFQRNCLRSTAEYKVLSQTSLSVLNTCFEKDGKTSDIEGKASVVDQKSPGKLEVQFKIFLINPKGDYWITELDPDYQWAVVSGPGKKYNFLLSREFPMQEELKQQILTLLKAKGYPVEDFIFDRKEGQAEPQSSL